MLKRSFDIVIALLGLLVFSPLFLVVSILVKLDSAGPIFYRAPRIGMGGRAFRMFKFRTMVDNADKVGPAITVDKDPRLTEIGAPLRKSRLDEIPQLINVLRGDMSMVGPRPEAPCYVERYSPEQRQVLKVKPGMTGPAQIAFRHEEEALSNPQTVDDEYMNVILPPKLARDLKYIEQQSLGLDLKLLFQTARALLADGLWAALRRAPSRLDKGTPVKSA
ncbi:MAG: sugar transferase [Anaerolineae bacterium]|jgi:lipopolysaccharide/colanic/teichoic acid biosynthesis glycosyltransferase